MAWRDSLDIVRRLVAKSFLSLLEFQLLIFFLHFCNCNLLWWPDVDKGQTWASLRWSGTELVKNIYGGHGRELTDGQISFVGGQFICVHRRFDSWSESLLSREETWDFGFASGMMHSKRLVSRLRHRGILFFLGNLILFLWNRQSL